MRTLSFLYFIVYFYFSSVSEYFSLFVFLLSCSMSSAVSPSTFSVIAVFVVVVVVVVVVVFVVVVVALLFNVLLWLNLLCIRGEEGVGDVILNATVTLPK